MEGRGLDRDSAVGKGRARKEEGGRREEGRVR